MWQMLLVSKEVFSLISMSKMAAIRMDIKVYRLQAQSSCKWRLLPGKIVVKFVLEQEHNSSLWLSYLYAYYDIFLFTL